MQAYKSLAAYKYVGFVCECTAKKFEDHVIHLSLFLKAYLSHLEVNVIYWFKTKTNFIKISIFTRDMTCITLLRLLLLYEIHKVLLVKLFRCFMCIKQFLLKHTNPLIVLLMIPFI